MFQNETNDVKNIFLAHLLDDLRLTQLRWRLASGEGVVTQRGGASRLMSDSKAHFQNRCGIDRQFGLLAESLPTTIHQNYFGKNKIHCPFCGLMSELTYSQRRLFSYSNRGIKEIILRT